MVTDVDENAAPAFAAESAMFSVEENTAAGSNVGEPVVAMDEDGDELTYGISGSYFEIWPSGQITIADGAMLDHESMAYHMVTVTADDGKGGMASIAVTINVTNLGLDNAYDMNDDGAIDMSEAVAAVNDYFLEKISRDEVLVVLGYYFGADAEKGDDDEGHDHDHDEEDGHDHDHDDDHDHDHGRRGRLTATTRMTS